MKIDIISPVTLVILPVFSMSTGNPEVQIQCPSLPPNQHVSRFHCKMADGSLIHVDGPGPFDCEMSYIAIRPPTSKGSMNQYSEKLSDKVSQHCELLLIKFINDGVVQHRCCQDGVAVFATQEHQVSSPQPIGPIDGMQKPLQHLQTADQVMDKKLQTKNEEEIKYEYDDEDDGYGDDEGTDEGEEDYEYGDDDDDDDAEDEDEKDEYGEEYYEDYGVDEDIDYGDSLNSEGTQEPGAQEGADKNLGQDGL
ncbi:hypothetical protein FNYG_01579 [Fusarium nygamai]|uniref:Uncharacterized protein n=1 Tax=Gibberella nygamai TaxID=42673 RepID=A0A2K0WS51_GIBNY|nr:hypothetical protein FNYG_01579 [Fusarium nygamai]